MNRRNFLLGSLACVGATAVAGVPAMACPITDPYRVSIKAVKVVETEWIEIFGSLEEALNILKIDLRRGCRFVIAKPVGNGMRKWKMDVGDKNYEFYVQPMEGK